MQNVSFRFARPLLAIAMVVVVAAGCSDDDDDGGGGGVSTQGNLQVFATDAPPELGRLRSVLVTIQRIEAIGPVTTGQTTNTATLFNSAVVGTNHVDLLPLRAGVRALIASNPADPGLYERVRVLFSDIAIDYQTPSGVQRYSTEDGSLIYGGEQQQGVDFVEFTVPDPVDLEAGENEAFVLDFDLADSIDVQGDTADPTTITFTPVGQARNLTPTSGSLAGVVTTDAGTTTNTDDTPVANAVVRLRQNGTTIGQTLTDAGGVYLLEGIEAGQYNLLVTGPDDRSFQSDVSVSDGQTTTRDALLTAAP